MGQELQRAGACAAELGHTLRVARALAEARRPLDLTGLDQEVGRLCAMALDLGPEDGRRMRPDLLALRDELARLEDAVRNGLPSR